MDDPEFCDIVEQAEEAINEEIHPTLIPQGSSGSYFVRNKNSKIIAVFKPKDEEPYGAQNPKWGKWVQRHCCPCCFGRSCLLANQGYLSEAGAYIVDQKLGLNVVPKTHVVRLASSAFHYSSMVRKKANAKEAICLKFPSWSKRFRRVGLPFKKGSFQLFVEGYKDSNKWIKTFESDPLPEATWNNFIFQFQCMVVLDYVIRNTDRGDANWLIRYDKTKPPEDSSESEDSSPQEDKYPCIKIAAIDNGLAFPIKHPDAWRVFPYHWETQSFAKIPFTKELTDLVLPKTSDPDFINTLCEDLRTLFKTDHGYSKKFFKKQVSVLKGQIANLNTALQEGKSPAELTKLPWLVVKGPNNTPFPVKVKRGTRNLAHEDSDQNMDSVTSLPKLRDSHKKRTLNSFFEENSSSNSDVTNLIVM